MLGVIFQEEKCSEQYSCYDECKWVPVKNKDELRRGIVQLYKEADLAVMYSFGMIIPEDLLELMPIYNFHPGDLLTNRGSSPVNWSILLNQSTTKMTLHRVRKAVDTGIVVSERICRIYKNDVPMSLQKRLEGEIPSMMLDLIDFSLKQRRPLYKVDNGIYRGRITETDFTILPKDTREIVSAKIRSQYEFNGAVIRIGEEKRYVKTMEEYDRIVANNEN